MEIVITRLKDNGVATVGTFVCDSGPSYHSMELPHLYLGKANVHELTCILAGRYPVKNLWSGHFGMLMPHICEVPDRTEIEIHFGSYPKDIKGCCSIGTALINDDPKTAGDVVITGTKDAFLAFDKLFLQALDRKEECWITVIDQCNEPKTSLFASS